MTNPHETEQANEMWWLAEFGCWTMVVLAPILSWVNGPAVSTDQFVVRTAVFTLALTGGVTLRIVKLIRRRRGPT